MGFESGYEKKYQGSGTKKGNSGEGLPSLEKGKRERRHPPCKMGTPRGIDLIEGERYCRRKKR